MLKRIIILFSLLFSHMVYADTLRLYNWAHYIDADILKEFSATSGHSIEYDIYNSNAQMLDMLEGGATYDLIFPSVEYVNKLKKANLIQKIDFQKLTFLSDFKKDIVEDKRLNGYAIPYFIGTISILSQKDLHIKSFEDLWRDELRGRVYILDDPEDMFLIALKSLDAELSNVGNDEIKRAYEKLLALTPNIKGSFKDRIDLEVKFRNNDIDAAIIYDGEVGDIAARNASLEFLTDVNEVLFWMDGVVVGRDANIELAYEFLNFMFSRLDVKKSFGYTPFIVTTESAKFKKALSQGAGLDENDSYRGYYEEFRKRVIE